MSNNVFLPSYSIGDNVYNEIDSICKSYGKKAIVIGGETAIEKSKNLLLDGLKNSNIEILDFLWFGSDATYENVERLKNNKKVNEADMIFAVGGGRSIDTNKVLSDKYNYKYNEPYFGTIFNDETEEKIKKVTEYMKKENNDFIYISSDAALYMIPLKQSNKEFDLLLLGNLGKEGENGVIEKIKEVKGKKKILMNKEKFCWQESDKVIEFVKNNFTNVGEIKIGEIEDILIYE